MRSTYNVIIWLSGFHDVLSESFSTFSNTPSKDQGQFDLSFDLKKTKQIQYADLKNPTTNKKDIVNFE